jgi:hypothetical protein
VFVAAKLQLGFLLALGLPAVVQGAILSEQDDRLLTGNLQALAKGWVQEAVDSANTILWKPAYSRKHWRRFFSGYFTANPFTEDLRNYLAYPVFGWGPGTSHRELQEGLARCLQGRLEELLKAHGANLGKSLNRDAELLETLCKVTRFLNYLAGSRETSRKTKDRLYWRHLVLIGESIRLRTSYRIDISRYPYLGRIRSQLYMNLVSFAAPDAADGKAPALRALPRQTRNEIAAAIALRGERLQIWRKHAVLLIDNSGLDSKQLSAVGRLLELVPAALHNLGAVTVEEFLGKKVDWYDCAVGCVNIGGVKIGAVKENGFPVDVVPRHSDIFCMIWAHEFNHVVDLYYVHHDNPRRKRLLEQAGNAPLNYLRSMVPEGVFTKAPQEFFASISNQYFASSEHTLALGLARFRKGHKEPLNQFLFFADVYSLRGESTLFYGIDVGGRMTRTTIPLTRDRNGFINSLRVKRKLYRFTRDANGNVTACQAG